MEVATIIVAAAGAGGVGCCAGANLARKRGPPIPEPERKLKELQGAVEDLTQTVKDNEQIYVTLEQYMDEEIAVADQVMDKFESFVLEYPPEHTSAIQAMQGMEAAISDILKDCQDITENTEQTVQQNGANKGQGAQSEYKTQERNGTLGQNLALKLKQSEARANKAHTKIEELTTMIETIQLDIVQEAKRSVEIQKEAERLKFPSFQHMDALVEKYEALEAKYSETHEHREKLASELDYHRASHEQEKAHHTETKKRLSQTGEAADSEPPAAKEPVAPLARASATSAKQEETIRQLRKDLAAADAKVAQARSAEQKAARLQRDLEQSQKEATSLKSQLAEATKARGPGGAAPAQSGAQLGAQSGAQATREKEAAQRERDQALKEKKALQEKCDKFKADYEQARKDKFTVEAKLNIVQKDLDDVKRDVATHKTTAASAKKEADEAKRSHGSAQKDATTLQTQVKTLQDAKGAADAQVKQLQDKTKKLEEELRASKAAASTVQKLTDENQRLKDSLKKETEKSKASASMPPSLTSSPAADKSSTTTKSFLSFKKDDKPASSPSSSPKPASSPVSSPTGEKKFLFLNRDEAKVPATSPNLQASTSDRPRSFLNRPANPLDMASETEAPRRRFMP